MAAERLAPDALLVQTNLSGTVTDIQDDPDSPDANWLTQSSGGADTEARVSFPSPSDTPTTGAGLQEFKVQVRSGQVSGFTGNGTEVYDIFLYEGGTEVATLATAVAVPDSGAQVDSYTWNASLLADASGADVECRILGHVATGGGPGGSRAAIEVGAVEWNAEVDPLSGDLSATEATDTAAFDGGVTVQGDLAATEVADAASFDGNVITEGELAVTEAQDVAAFSNVVDRLGVNYVFEQVPDGTENHTITAVFDSAPQANERLFIILGFEDSFDFEPAVLPPPPSGWTTVLVRESLTGGTAPSSIIIFTKIADGTEGTNFTFDAVDEFGDAILKSHAFTYRLSESHIVSIGGKETSSFGDKVAQNTPIPLDPSGPVPFPGGNFSIAFLLSSNASGSGENTFWEFDTGLADPGLADQEGQDPSVRAHAEGRITGDTPQATQTGDENDTDAVTTSLVVLQLDEVNPVGDLAATEMQDVAAFDGEVGAAITGDLAATEAQDTASIDGEVLVAGDLATTDAQDTAAFSGDVVVQGDLSATETQDVADFQGASTLEGDLAAVEQADAAAFDGDVVVQGDLSATDVADAASIDGSVEIQGDLSATEATDTAAFDGSVAVEGDLAATDAVDTAAFTGEVVVQGDLAATDAADIAALSGEVVVQGDLAATEDQDIAAFSGSETRTGDLAATEQPDALAFEGGVTVQGDMAAAEALDTAALSGDVIVQGDAAVTESQDVAEFTGASITEGDLAATEQADALASSGEVTIQGDIAAAESTDTASLDGSVAVEGDLASIEATDVAAFSGEGVVQGDLAATEAQDTAAINGRVLITATVAATEAQDGAAVSGTVAVAGDLVGTEASDVFGAAGTILISGDLAASESADTASFTAAPPVEWLQLTDVEVSAALLAAHSLRASVTGTPSMTAELSTTQPLALNPKE